MVTLLVAATLVQSNAEAHDASVGFAQAAETARSQLHAIAKSQEDAATAARRDQLAHLDNLSRPPGRPSGARRWG